MIRKIIKQKHKVLYLFPKSAQQRISDVMTEILCFLRKLNLLPFSLFKSLKRYRNMHKGKRCFILATGPSLTIEDINKLKDEITFGMNSIVLLFNDTKWRPTYYVSQDQGAFSSLCMEDSVAIIDVKGVFISPEIDNWMRFAGKKPPYDYDIYPYNNNKAKCIKVDDDREYIPSPFKIRFSGNAYAAVYGWSVAYSCLQIAVYMGFTEIYLLGADCNYVYGKCNNIAGYGHQDRRGQAEFRAVNENTIAMYRSAKEYADKHGIEIYNASRGGNLEVFERVDLDEVLSRGQG